jgi:hypothetical protein
MYSNCPIKDIPKLERILNIWEDRQIYSPDFVDAIRNQLGIKRNGPGAPPVQRPSKRGPGVKPAFDVNAAPEPVESGSQLVTLLLEIERGSLRDTYVASKVKGEVLSTIRSLSTNVQGVSETQLTQARETLSEHKRRLSTLVTRHKHLLSLLTDEQVVAKQRLEKAKRELMECDSFIEAVETKDGSKAKLIPGKSSIGSEKIPKIIDDEKELSDDEDDEVETVKDNKKRVSASAMTGPAWFTPNIVPGAITDEDTSNSSRSNKRQKVLESKTIIAVDESSSSPSSSNSMSSGDTQSHSENSSAENSSDSSRNVSDKDSLLKEGDSRDLPDNQPGDEDETEESSNGVGTDWAPLPQHPSSIINL